MLSLWEKLYQAHTLPKSPQNKTQKVFYAQNPKHKRKIYEKLLKQNYTIHYWISLGSCGVHKEPGGIY